MLCPRDSSALEVVSRADGKLEVDVCRQCGGLWLDSAELAALCPTAAHLPERKDEVILTALASSETGKLQATMRACPRCKGAPFEIRLAGLLLDFCAGCGGVWVDGDEVARIVREPPAERAVAMPGGSPFRRAAAELAADGKASCAQCKQRVAEADLYAKRDGFVCFVCWAAEYQEQADERARAGALVRALVDTLFDFVITPMTALHAVLDGLGDKRPKGWR